MAFTSVLGACKIIAWCGTHGLETTYSMVNPYKTSAVVDSRAFAIALPAYSMVAIHQYTSGGQPSSRPFKSSTCRCSCISRTKLNRSWVVTDVSRPVSLLVDVLHPSDLRINLY